VETAFRYDLKSNTVQFLNAHIYFVLTLFFRLKHGIRISVLKEIVSSEQRKKNARRSLSWSSVEQSNALKVTTGPALQSWQERKAMKTHGWLRRGPGPNPGKSVWNLFCANWHWDRSFFRYFGVPTSVSFHQWSLLAFDSFTTGAILETLATGSVKWTLKMYGGKVATCKTDKLRGSKVKVGLKERRVRV